MGNQTTYILNNSSFLITVTLEYYPGESHFKEREIKPSSSQKDEYNLTVTKVKVIIAHEDKTTAFVIKAGTDVTVAQQTDATVSFTYTDPGSSSLISQIGWQVPLGKLGNLYLGQIKN